MKDEMQAFLIGTNMKKISNKKIKRLNDLLIMNYEAEKIYLEALDIVTDDNLKTFFRERGFERNEYGKQLRTEIKALGGEPKHLEGLSNEYHKIWTNFRNILKEGDETELLYEVCYIKQLSIDKYDELLHIHRLPISLCKTLVDQRDNIQSAMNLIRVNKRLVA